MMYAEIRKLHLIGEVLKIDNEYTLSALEAILRNDSEVKDSFNSPFAALSGIWSDEEAKEIETIIMENCEQINQNDWK